MSNIHYFQRYSQKENMVTNNTLLLFSRLYSNNPNKFMLFINALLEDSQIELDTTVRFKQQEKASSGTIPDGFLEQESFKVVIETKLYGQEGIQQLKGHLDSFEKEDKQILLLINKEPIAEDYIEKITGIIQQNNDEKESGIIFASTTFKEICRHFDDIVDEYEIEMKALINDYEEFCNESGLIENIDTKIRVILTGKTYSQNLKYNIYYHPSDRGYQNTKFLGLYHNKAVRAIGEISCILDANINGGIVKVINNVQGEFTDDMKKDIAIVTREAKEKFGYILNENHRFFFVHKYYETEFIKKSKGGLLGTRYIDLNDIEGFDAEMSASTIASLLNGKQWDTG